MSNKKRNFARFGVATKGVVYLLIGSLTALAAFNLGGQKANSGNVLDFISRQVFGQVLLGAIAAGLIGYVFWRWYQAFTSFEQETSTSKAVVKRIAYFGSGLFYGLLAISAIKRVIGAGSDGKSIVASLLSSTYATTLLIVIGVIILIKSLYEFYKAYSGKFREHVDESDLKEKAKKMVINVGKIGHTARGIVSGIMAYLFFRAAYQGSKSDVGKVDVFNFLQDTFGQTIMGIIAVGLIVYGVFMLITSKYSSLNVN
ncbi:DUF1206 domain-containing protein [Altibacter sp.]|uniref:DUF1206 domain-containing protein n=1 Tax=Altibacter sp. TaxID=2024823 RepID=UPI00258882A2|nr:DUF1206 domain-containing protein [Altibacter sp.]MCW9038494.1 DUF1206 domain-containing protein [Altibacter sp.]